jgi:hypothetical protein
MSDVRGTHKHSNYLRMFQADPSKSKLFQVDTLDTSSCLSRHLAVLDHINKFHSEKAK